MAAVIRLQTSILRTSDGLVAGVRVYAPKVADALFWLDREDGSVAELRLYRFDMKVTEPRS